MHHSRPFFFCLMPPSYAPDLDNQPLESRNGPPLQTQDPDSDFEASMALARYRHKHNLDFDDDMDSGHEDTRMYQETVKVSTRI